MPIFMNEPKINQAMSTPDLEAYRSNEEDIVICGVSGQFLESNDVEEYADSLLGGRNEEMNLSMNQSMRKQQQRGQTRSTAINWENVEFVGVDVASKLANMDMEAKKLVECVYDAVFDSGVNPAVLANSQTGVFIGTCEDQLTGSQKTSFDFNTLKSTGSHQLADQVCSVLKLKGILEFIYL